ncbi:hypothetical protein [Stutzerimonas nitrititolerans]|uniref:hypothetical protein n=1 Tax=Stutzerimonas nitrititolerans TaxID=2482751 RepID=UPI0015E287F3|nr:hypothetical protein [Stutzerimonas nitrititolerans]MBA1183779.1 hypothetical protein [Stutzerimonas stutzeri]
MSIFSNFFQNIAVNGYIKDVKKTLPIYKCLGPLELVDAKVSAAVALSFIVEDSKTQSSGGVNKALESMYHDIALTKEQGGYLSLYNSRLISIQREAHGKTNPINKMIAAGIPIWLISYMQKILEIEQYLGNHPPASIINGLRSLETPSAFAKK